jgi:hypothetical protein
MPARDHNTIGIEMTTAKPDLGKLTRFQKGQIPNPKGRPKDIYNVAALARTLTRKAIETLDTIMADKEVAASARVAAAVAILDRGWGKPMQAHDVRLNVEIRNLSDVELLELINEYRGAETFDREAGPGTLLPPPDSTELN